jgi:hypothetical protein
MFYNLRPTTVWLLKPQSDLTKSFQVDHGRFTVDWVVQVSKIMRFDVEPPLLSILAGCPGNLILPQLAAAAQRIEQHTLC